MAHLNFPARGLSSAPLGYLTRPAAYTLLFLAALAMWLRFQAFSSNVVGDNLDGSWVASFGYFLTHRLQAGKDYIFTFGPLGYFWNSTYDADLFWYKYWYELAVKLSFVIVVMKFVSHLPSLLAKLLFCAILTILGYGKGLELTYLVIILLGITAVKEDNTSFRWWVPVSLLLAVLSLVKFTFFILAVVVLVLVSLNILGNKGRWAALRPLALFTAWFSLGWLILGQSLGNLPRYLVMSLWITSGYDAMACQGSIDEVYLALIILATVGGSLVPFSAQGLPAAWRGLGSLRQLSRLGFLGAIVFLQWKHGFTRHDTHSACFFSFMMLLPFLLPVLFPVYDWAAPLRVRLATACFFLSFIGFTMSSGVKWIEYLSSLSDEVVKNGEVVLDPFGLRRKGEEQQAAKKQEFALPLIKARVGDAPVDIISYEQGVLFLNDMNWRPRPVFQSYSAYTPALLAANAEFFHSADAPEYVLFKLQTIDERLPTLDDGSALIEILRHYQPVLMEKGYLLLEHRRDQGAGDGEFSGEVVLEKRVRFGEAVDLRGLPGKYHTLALTIKPSWTGRLWAFFYKSPEVHISVATASGEEPLNFRLIPAMAEGGFLLNPFVAGMNDVIGLYDPSSTERRVTSFQITTNDKGSFQEDILVTVKAFPKVVSGPLDPAVLVKLRYPMMRTPFVRVAAHEPVTIEQYDGTDVIRVHAPSEMEFALPSRPGRHRVVGKFGILPGAYENRGEDCTDGVRFTVEYTTAGGTPQVLFERYLDPHANPQDRGMQEFALWLPPGEEGKLVLRASNLPGKTEHLDWSYWTDFEIEGAKPGTSEQPEVDDEDAVYRKMMQQLPKVVRSTVPAGAAVFIVCKGGDKLLWQVGPEARSFMQEKDGSPAYYYPEDSADAIARLEALRTKGAEFLVLPRTEFWWLDEYRGFKEHLDSHYRCLRRDDTCIIYQLSRPAAKGAGREENPEREASAP